MDIRVFTIGHSTRSLEEMGELLIEYGVEVLVDVRTMPRSRTNPQFNREDFPHALRSIRIGYRYFPGLGGLRKTSKESPNGAWRNASFRGYADYMQTPAFQKNLERLITLSDRKKVALMCAEAVPWRCHRSLIADALTARRIPVVEILSASNSRVHELRDFAKVRGGRVIYPL